MGSRLERFARSLRYVDRWLPDVCLVCGASAGAIPNLCDGCERAIGRIRAPCPRCAAPADGRVCGACAVRSPPWDGALAAASFDPIARHLVHRLKFRGDLASAAALGGLLAAAAGSREPVRPVLVPVPLHRTRLRRRGFNQAGEIAAVLGALLATPVRADLLVRTRPTAPQAGLRTPRERRANVRGAFRARARRPVPPHVTLVDDVLTTGATLVDCTRALRRAGAARVDVWVCARVAPGSAP